MGVEVLTSALMTVIRKGATRYSMKPNWTGAPKKLRGLGLKILNAELP